MKNDFTPGIGRTETRQATVTRYKRLDAPLIRRRQTGLDRSGVSYAGNPATVARGAREGETPRASRPSETPNIKHQLTPEQERIKARKFP